MFPASVTCTLRFSGSESRNTIFNFSNMAANENIRPITVPQNELRHFLKGVEVMVRKGREVDKNNSENNTRGELLI